jgi:ABC-2 type transport system permease protein
MQGFGTALPFIDREEFEGLTMKKYYFILVKEFLQIARDLPGLGLLFLMPALMLLVISLTQEKVMLGMDSETNVILVNLDQAALGEDIQGILQNLPNINLEVIESEKEAEKRVFTGQNQVLVIIPDSASEKLGQLAWQHAADTGMTGNPEINKLEGIRLLYDPAMMKLYKDIMGYSLQMIIESSALKIYVDSFKTALQTSIEKQFDDHLAGLVPVDLGDELPDFPGKEELIPSIRSVIEERSGNPKEIHLPVGNFGMEALVDIEEGVAGGQESLIESNIVSNNVPAFILFAMFFIVIPLAGSILNEKQQGTRDRLITLPVTWFTLFSGKITVYLMVCILQFIMMVCIGRYLLPVISSLPPLSLDVHPAALVAVTIASALAAIGFGLLIGTFSSTFLQAAPIGSVLVVILAFLGGIFVPSYMMPEIVSKISVISPLRWGSDAFYSIFARNAGIETVLIPFFSLLVFFIVALILSFRAISKHL